MSRRDVLAAALAAYPADCRPPRRSWGPSIFAGQVDDGHRPGHAYSEQEIRARRDLIVAAVNAVPAFLALLDALSGGDCPQLRVDAIVAEWCGPPATGEGSES